MSVILTVFHVVCGMAGVGLGAMVLFGLFNGKVLDKFTVLFLQLSLAASIAGLLFQLHPLMPAQKVSMLSVYVSGVAIIAWRKFKLTGVWSAIFAFTATIVLCLDVLMIVIQAFKWIVRVSAYEASQSTSPLLVTQLLVMGLFVVLGVWAARKFSESFSHTV
jgi:hypothetical protein